MCGVIVFSRIQCSGIETGQGHHPVVLSLAVITTDSIITRIRDDVDWIWVIIVDRAAYLSTLGQAFDIFEGLLFYRGPLEFNSLTDQAQ